MNRYIVQSTDINAEDIRQAVAIHSQEIRQGFLSSLGEGVLQQIFSHAANSRFGVLLIAKTKAGGYVCGFLLGTLDLGAFYKEFVVRRGLSALIASLPNILSLNRIRMAKETLLYPFKRHAKVLSEAELLDLAILREHQGKGLAQLLFHEFSALLLKKRFKQIKITTGESLVRAQSFYIKLGAVRVDLIEIHKGKKAVVYSYTIPDVHQS